LRVAEVEKMDIQLYEGSFVYRTKLKISFKYHSKE